MDIAAILSADTLNGILTFAGVGLVGAALATYLAAVKNELRPQQLPLINQPEGSNPTDAE